MVKLWETGENEEAIYRQRHSLIETGLKSRGTALINISPIIIDVSAIPMINKKLMPLCFLAFLPSFDYN